MKKYDSAKDTAAHIQRVRDHLTTIKEELSVRSLMHDWTKLHDPEKSAFDSAVGLKTLEYGTPEYDAAKKNLGAALDHHYKNHRHHPEHAEYATEWRDVCGYERLYQVSRSGYVRSNKQLLKGFVTPKGYFRLQLSKEGVQKNYMVHRLVAKAFIPNPDELPQVNHKDGNKQNNAVGNLEWATASGNLQHAYDNDLKQASVKYAIYCPELDITTMGCDRMASELRARGYNKASAAGVWACANGKQNTHLDLTFEGTLLSEWQQSYVNDMSLIDIMEMLCDWKAATERMKDGDMRKSLEINRTRFNIGDQLYGIIVKTAQDLNFIE